MTPETPALPAALPSPSPLEPVTPEAPGAPELSIGLDKEKKNLVLLVKGQGFQAAFQFGPEEAADLTVRLARLTQELAPRRSPIVVPQKNGPPIVSQAGNLRFPR